MPADLAITTTTCAYCGQQSVLPPSLLAARHHHHAALLRAQAAQHSAAQNASQARPKQRHLALWAIFLIVPVVLSGIAILVIVIIANSDVHRGRGAALEPSPARPEQPVRPPPSRDDRSTGMTRMTALMKVATTAGCKRVVMAPQVMQGPQQMTWTAVTGSCVHFFVTTGVRDNPLSVELRTPFGERLETPAASTEMDFTQCPKTKGPHRLDIRPATEDFYTLSGVECPLPRAAAPKKRALAAASAPAPRPSAKAPLAAASSRPASKP